MISCLKCGECLAMILFKDIFTVYLFAPGCMKTTNIFQVFTQQLIPSCFMKNASCRLVQGTRDQYLSKSKKVTMEKVTQVIEVKSNFRKKTSLQTSHHYLPVTQYNAVNSLLGTETINLSLRELNERSCCYTR